MSKRCSLLQCLCACSLLCVRKTPGEPKERSVQATNSVRECKGCVVWHACNHNISSQHPMFEVVKLCRLIYLNWEHLSWKFPSSVVVLVSIKASSPHSSFSNLWMPSFVLLPLWEHFILCNATLLAFWFLSYIKQTFQVSELCPFDFLHWQQVLTTFEFDIEELNRFAFPHFDGMSCFYVTTEQCARTKRVASPEFSERAQCYERDPDACYALTRRASCLLRRRR